MDTGSPTKVPCTCNQLNNGKSVQLLSGAYMRTWIFSRFLWHDCPRHGWFDGWRDKLTRELPVGLYSQMVRDWMYAESGYRFGCEPPWEPDYENEMTERWRAAWPPR